MLTEVNEISFQLDSFDPILQQKKTVQGRNIHVMKADDSERFVTA